MKNTELGFFLFRKRKKFFHVFLFLRFLFSDDFLCFFLGFTFYFFKVNWCWFVIFLLTDDMFMGEKEKDKLYATVIVNVL